MIKAIGSKIWLDGSDPLAIIYISCIQDLLELEDVKNLDNYHQHLNTSRLQHSINVSYYTFLCCKALGFDYRSGARAGILHDLFLYDWRVERQPEGRHAYAHPKVALRNAKKNVDLNPIEIDAIIKHMWPLTPIPPRYKEAFVLTMMDKYCAILEVFYQSFYMSFGHSRFLRVLFGGGVFMK